jgi:hypothetical protein
MAKSLLDQAASAYAEAVSRWEFRKAGEFIGIAARLEGVEPYPQDAVHVPPDEDD